jgi:hypothetical protein
MKKSFIALSLFAILLVLVSGCTNLTNNNNGKIIISTTPNGSEVYLNDTYKGTTPNTIDAVSPGAYEIELRLKDYQTYSELITIQSNDVHHISVSLMSITPVPTPIPTRIQTPTPTQTSLPLSFEYIENNDNTPLLIVIKDGFTHTSRDILTFSGIGPKGRLVTISITESNTGVTYYSFKTAKIETDGTWLYNYDLKTIPIASGQATVQASILGTNTRTSPLLINIIP